jgi:hypothetical protein
MEPFDCSSPPLEVADEGKTEGAKNTDGGAED